jgi:LysM repeat protein
MLSRFVGVRSRRVLRLSVVAAIAASAVGCSSDVTRVSDNSPDARSDQGVVAPMPAERPLPASTTGEITGTIGASGAPSSSGKQGGIRIVLGPGETIDTVARKYGVPVRALMKANAITNPTTIAPGQHLMIPRHIVHGTKAKLAHAAAPRNAVAAAPALTPGVAPSPIPAVPSKSAVHLVAQGDTLATIAHKHLITVRALVAANAIDPESPLEIGSELTIPTRHAVTPKAKSKPVKVGQAL